MRRLLIVVTAVALALTASPAVAKPKARISGSLSVGSTITVVSRKGTPKRVKWQSCPAPIVSNTCAAPQLVARGRSLTLDDSFVGLSVRAVATIKGRTVATKWSSPVIGASSAVVVPAGWQITGGSPADITSNQAAISSAYAEIARLVGGGRFLSHFEGGSSGILIQRELTMCSDQSFRFVDAAITDVTGTWRITVSFSNPQDIAPRLVLTDSTGQVDTVKLDLNAEKPGHVLLAGEDFLSGPSSSCS